MKMLFFIMPFLIALSSFGSAVRSSVAGRNSLFAKDIQEEVVAVEWLESSLTNLMYIDTKIVPDIKCKIRCKYQRQGKAAGDGSGNYKALFGGNFDGDVNHLCYGAFSHGPWNTRFDFHVKLYYGNLIDYTSGITDKALQELEIDSSTLKVNGVVQSTSIHMSGVESELPMRLFSGDNEYANWVRIWYFSIERDGVLLIDLVPVRVGDIGCMYDFVSGNLFFNQGTGSFIIGPDL